MLIVHKTNDHVVVGLQTTSQRPEFVVDTKWMHSEYMTIIFRNFLPVIYVSDFKMFILLVKTFQMCFTPSDPSQRWQKTFRISRNHVCWCFIWRLDAIAFII